MVYSVIQWSTDKVKTLFGCAHVQCMYYDIWSSQPKTQTMQTEYFFSKAQLTFLLYSYKIHVINNYWMRLSMISWIIKTKVCIICRSRRPRQITQTQGFDNSWYHAETKFNNCFIIHFSHNSSAETEAKHSAILFLKRTLQGA